MIHSITMLFCWMIDWMSTKKTRNIFMFRLAFCNWQHETDFEKNVQSFFTCTAHIHNVLSSDTATWLLCSTYLHVERLCRRISNCNSIYVWAVHDYIFLLFLTSRIIEFVEDYYIQQNNFVFYIRIPFHCYRMIFAHANKTFQLFTIKDNVLNFAYHYICMHTKTVHRRTRTQFT